MNPAAPLYPPKATPAPEPQGVAAPKPPVTALQNPPHAAAPAAPVQGPQPTAPAPVSPTPAPASAMPQAAKPVTPRPIMSAKAAINAMYAAEKGNSGAKLVPSAREAVNAASRLAPKNFKSASNLHHGSLQKVQKVQPAPRSMESTRTSASALIRTVGSEHKDVPVVHTSLKLGASAKPKHEPVVLPAGARMAEAARPVANLSDTDGMAMLGHASRKPGNAVARVITSGRPKLAAPGSARRIRDPQMLNGGRRVLSARNQTTVGVPASTNMKPVSGARTLAASNSAGSAASHGQNLPAQGQGSVARLSQSQASASGLRSARATSNSAVRSMDLAPARKLVRPRRFRTAPKNYAEADAPAVSVDDSYAIAEPPKLAVRRRSDAKSEDLGVVKNYHPSKLPEPIGDAAPIGRLAEQRVASGSGGPARPEPAIKAENTSNYSFSKRDSKAKTSYTSADKSPFLKSVTVEKRPLSDSSVPTPISLPRTAEVQPEKASRKNSYQKRADAKAELPSRPTVIVPSSRRSKAPLFFLILFTIILGAAVGAAVYLCFFQ